MSGYVGTSWVRKKDNVLVRIIGDSESLGSSPRRALLAENRRTGRLFWTSPNGLARKYDRCSTQ